MEQQELIPHLFRTEFRKITAVICKTFGLEHIEVAEDIAGETFLAALETWTYKGLPQNPTAWLYAVAKNKAKNYLRRNKVFIDKISLQIKEEAEIKETLDFDLSDRNIFDSQLHMLFAICHPAISAESQISLALRILCGFGIDEIATAFLTSKETINKRLSRAKEKLRNEKAGFVPIKSFISDEEINKRLETVLSTLYLLFSEGYYSESNDKILRSDLCQEAMRLTFLLIENEQTNQPSVNALLSLMCFHASRFEARKNENEEIILYNDQDETLWDKSLICQGAYFLNKASTGNEISKYHLEAGIAYWHTIKSDSKEKWENILQLYNNLLQLEYSPIAALNRIYVLSKVKGKEIAIAEAEKLPPGSHQLYHLLLGELYSGFNNIKALSHLNRSLKLTKSSADKKMISHKILKCRQKIKAKKR